MDVEDASTLIAEMISLFEASREGIWIRTFRDELKIKWKDESTQLWYDNAGPIKTVNNIGFDKRSKHDKLKCSFIQEKVLVKKIVVSHFGFKDNVADMFTKASGSDLLKDLIKLSAMNVQEGVEYYTLI